MINKQEAKVDAYVKIAELMGKEYFLGHIEKAVESYPADDYDEINWEYFLGFEGDKKTGLWTVFVRVSVNRETEQVTFLDYKLPNGQRMDHPLKPISFA